MGDGTGPWETLQAIRGSAPLVHNITNLVAMDLSANLLLAVGASPVMAHAVDEVGDFVGLADALTINIGTPSPPWIEAMSAAAAKAAELEKPWVLDPVGAGATEYRRGLAARLSRMQPAVIRGNASEILALGSGQEVASRGVDSSIEAVEALDAAHDLARATGAVVAITGPIDYVTDGDRLVAVANGDPLMTRVTALGCALSCLVGAACAVNFDRLVAAAHALVILGVAAELAAADASGPASFRSRLIDALFNLDEASLTDHARIE